MSKKVSGWPLIVPRELPEGLPAYTDADADKMLIVGADETDVVPAQTVTASELGGAEITGLVESLFVPGAAVKVTMDGVTYPIVAVTEETVTTPQGDVTYYEALFFESEGYAIQYYPDDEEAGLTITSGTHTIEAVVMDVTGPAWAAAAASGGVELVAMPYGINNVQQSANHSAESKTFSVSNTIDIKYAGKKILSMFVVPNWGTGPCPNVWITWPSSNPVYWPRNEEVQSDGRITVLLRHQESSGAAYNWNFYYYAVIAM